MPDLTLGPIGQLAVNVRDLPRAVAFYRDVLGLPFLFEAGPMAFFDCAGVRLLLSAADEGAGTSIVYYRVDDLEGAHARLLQRGVTIREAPHLVARMPDHELWMLFFEDSEGNVAALMSERGKA